MSWVNWLWAADIVAAGLFFGGYVWLSARCWADLTRKPARVRHPGHYGTRGE